MLGFGALGSAALGALPDEPAAVAASLPGGTSGAGVKHRLPVDSGYRRLRDDDLYPELRKRRKRRRDEDEPDALEALPEPAPEPPQAVLASADPQDAAALSAVAASAAREVEALKAAVLAVADGQAAAAQAAEAERLQLEAIAEIERQRLADEEDAIASILMASVF